MQQTSQYKLNLIESGDTFSATPLNENAEKLESALCSLTQSIAAVGLEGVKLSTGTYTGTGTYGTAHPNTLTFAFVPQLVVVAHSSAGARFGVWLRGTSSGCAFFSSSSVTEVQLSWDGNSVSWSHTGSASSQLNNTGTAYHYLAVGLN